ncbi:MAG: septum formation initiator family protein [Clostridiales bacterium]|nr:septum formation initiator family protein [Clostridiales bacterium]
MKKKPKFRINLITGIVFITVIASVVMVIKGIMIQPVIAANNQKAAQITEDIDYENQRIKEIDDVMQKAGTDEYIEKVAREKLGMIKADEIVFIDISGQ